MEKAVTAIVLLTLVGCTRPDATRKLLEDNGYSNITITGYAFFYAGQDDIFSTGFEAISPSGKPVKGAVTGGLLKGYTIRFN